MTPEESELFDKIHTLATRHVDNTVTERELHELEELVIGDEHARHLYIDYMQELFHIASRLSLPSRENLASVFDSFATSVEIKPDGPSSRWQGVGWMGGVAAVAAILFIGGFLGLFGRLPQTTNVAVRENELSSGDSLNMQGATARRKVATLTEISNVVWHETAKEVGEYSRLVVGQNLNIAEGRIKLIFDSGMETLILAPCNLTIQDQDRIYCHHGRISGRASVGGSGFVIETPTALVTDLGTEFGIATDEIGQTDVAVFEGEVSIEKGTLALRQKLGAKLMQEHLVQGEAAHIDQDGQSTRISSVANTWLPTVRESSPSQSRDPIIQAVRDNITQRRPESRDFYRIVHAGFSEDSNAFVDRPHEWNGIDQAGLPKELLGADYVMPFNNDKFLPELQVDIFLSRPARLYLFLIDNVAAPAWLTDSFVDTGIDIGLDEGAFRYKPKLTLGSGPGNSIDSIFSVWVREVPHAQTISIGAIERPLHVKLGYCMYGIAAVELVTNSRL